MFQASWGETEEDADFTARMAHKHKTWSKEKAEDLYELLGLGDVRWRATADEIKASCMFFISLLFIYLFI